MGRSVSNLPAAPASLIDANGQPADGRFQGRCGEIDWRKLAPPLQRAAWWRRFHQKRWQYIGVACDDCFIGCAIVDVGWTTAAFAYVFDRRLGRVVGGLSRDGLPLFTGKVGDIPASGLGSAFNWLGAQLCFTESHTGAFELQVSGDAGFDLHIQLHDSHASPWLFAAGPVAEGVWHSTHKTTALAVTGTAKAGGQHYVLDGGFGSLDHSNGLLPRDTQWLWASAHSQNVGFNLQSGYFGDRENALWLDGKLIPLGKALFDFDPTNTMAPWHICTDDGLLDLHFTPEGERREDRDLLVAASRYVQPIGVYDGWVKSSPDAAPFSIRQLLGVSEQHHSRW